MSNPTWTIGAADLALSSLTFLRDRAPLHFGSHSLGHLCGTCLGLRDWDKQSWSYSMGTSPSVPVPNFSTTTSTRERYPRWELISNLALWLVWQAHSQTIWGATSPTNKDPSRLVSWAHTYPTESALQIAGNSETQILQWPAFLWTWRGGPFFNKHLGASALLTTRMAFPPPIYLTCHNDVGCVSWKSVFLFSIECPIISKVFVVI